MTALGDFSAGDVLLASDLNAIGAYTAYTPSSTGGLTLGNGTIQTFYTRINDFVHTYGSINLGSTSSVANFVDIALPVTNATSTFESPTGNALFWDNGGFIWKGATISVGTTTVRLIAELSSGTHTRYSDLSATVPFTWATSDAMTWNIMYRAA
jgi:hypothetical protein